jgi:excisionase family DNA binding protein
MVDMDSNQTAEPLLTVRQVAERLGLPHFKVSRAVKSGIIPSYRFYNSRRLLRLSEVLGVIESTRSERQR